jgi:hypothetical protein
MSAWHESALVTEIFFAYFPKCVTISEIGQRVSEGISMLS